MQNNTDKKEGLKKKIVNEMTEYLINVCYLAVVFAAFTQYQRFLLAAHDIDYTHYGVAVIEALILGKVIMIGSMFRLGRGFEHKPLVYPTLYKTVIFIFFVGVFKFIEHLIKALWHGEAFTVELFTLSEQGFNELLANSLVVFVALLPFFALKELERVFGTDKIWNVFFRNRDNQ
jgi:hypothetical protein